MQYTPGWDWIQPVRDRNTGIWDEVSITTTGPVCLSSPYIVTKVPGVRDPEAKTQKEAFVNTSLYGTRKGCEPLHAYYNPVTRKAGLLNTTLKAYTDLSLVARIYNLEGKLLWEKEMRTNSKANTAQELLDIPIPEGIKGAYFLRLALNAGVPNIYWLTTEPKDYTSLSRLPKSRPEVKTEIKKESSNFVATVRLGIGSKISFFNRIKVFDKETGKRVLPVHYSDNYITLMPGDQQEISLEFPADLPEERIQIVVDSYNSPLP